MCGEKRFILLEWLLNPFGKRIKEMISIHSTYLIKKYRKEANDEKYISKFESKSSLNILYATLKFNNSTMIF